MSPASPCNKVCQIHPISGWCVGCGRTLAEIAAWGDASDADRAEIVAAAAARRRRDKEARTPR